MNIVMNSWSANYLNRRRINIGTLSTATDRCQLDIDLDIFLPGVRFTKPKTGPLTGNSPFWEAQSGGLLSLKWPQTHQVKLICQLMDWCRLGTRPSAGKKKTIFLVQVFKVWKPPSVSLRQPLKS